MTVHLPRVSFEKIELELTTYYYNEVWSGHWLKLENSYFENEFRQNYLFSDYMWKVYWCSVVYEVFLGKEFMLSSIKFKILRFRPLVKKECEAADIGA